MDRMSRELTSVNFPLNSQMFKQTMGFSAKEMGKRGAGFVSFSKKSHWTGTGLSANLSE
jgi:hypothetical protein